MLYKDTNQYTTAGSAPLLNSATFFLEFISNTLINVPWNSEQLLFHFINKKNVYINICNVTSFIIQQTSTKSRNWEFCQDLMMRTLSNFVLPFLHLYVITKIMILMIVLVYVKVLWLWWWLSWISEQHKTQTTKLEALMSLYRSPDITKSS